MEKDYLKEAFKALEELNEDVFDISLSDGLEDAKDFMEEPVDDREEEIIIDPLAETEEDLEKDYLGKAILQCEICQSMIYKNPDEVVIDEEVGLANIDEACPFCQSEDGFKVIGQIEEFCDDEECEHKDDVDKEDKGEEEEVEIKETEEDEEEIEESIKTRKKLRLKENKKLKEDWDWNGDLPKIADYILDRFKDVKEISWNDFNDAVGDACRELLGQELDFEGTLKIDGKNREFLGDVETDLRIIMSLNGWETEFEGDNEGGLRLVESKSRDDIDANKDNKIEKAKKLLKKRIDDADSIKDERKKSAKKNFRKAQDDADSDRDYKLKKKGLKESKKLNESIYSEVQEFLKDATKYFKDAEEGCYYTPVTSDLYLVAGYPSDEDRPYVKIAFNDSSLQSDYEFDWNMPTYSDGEIAFVEISLKDNDLERDAKYLVREAQSMQKEIDKGNLLLESCKSRKTKKSLKESDKPAATSIKDAQKWVDYDMKKYGEISNRTNRLVKRAGFRIDKDQYGDYEVVAGTYESLKEDTIKQNGKWVNKGKEGTHGKFRTKKEADAQRKAMFANGYKECYDKKSHKEKSKKMVKEEYENELERLSKALEKLGWSVSDVGDEYEIENWSPAGEDLVEYLDKDDIIESVQILYDNYDPDEHAGLYIQDRGTRGIPSSIKVLLDDADRIEDMYHELRDAIVIEFGKDEKLEEDFERVDIETDREKMSMTSDENGKVTVTTEPKEENKMKETDEVIAPVSDELKAEFKSTEEETENENGYTDVEFDEFEEKDFDELGESYLRKVYENVRGFKTTKGSINGNQLKLEGVITFKSGKQAKTNFIFEAYNATKSGKLKFIGENKQFATGKKSFTLTGSVSGNKLVCESLNYSYVGKSADGTSKRLYGTVRK